MGVGVYAFGTTMFGKDRTPQPSKGGLFTKTILRYAVRKLDKKPPSGGWESEGWGYASGA